MSNDEKSNLSYRAGTNLTYNRKRGSGTSSQINSKTINDIIYIKPEDKEDYIAISVETGFTALGGTPEQAYSWLVFKLYDALRAAVDLPNSKIGRAVSDELREESSQGTRMPQDRQTRALMKGIEDFISIPRQDSETSGLSFKITTQDLGGTFPGILVDVDLEDTVLSDSISVHQNS